MVLIHTVASRELVAALSDEAKSTGVRIGMTLAEARALCPGLAHAPHDPGRDLRALEALARWMMRFTPVVAFDESLPHLARLVIYLDATGCERVFGGMQPLLDRVIAALDKFHLGARVAVAPTPGAAWALTFGKENRGTGVSPVSSQPKEHGRDARATIFSQEDLATALPPLPVGALRIDPETNAALRHLGIETIGQLMRLPRELLPSRFGDLPLRRLDQALGLLPEPLLPLTHHAPVEAAMDFDGVVQSIEALWEVFKQLIHQIVVELTKRGCGARRLEATFLRPDVAPIQKTIHLSAPSRDPVNLFNLLRCAMESIPLLAAAPKARRKFAIERHKVGQTFLSATARGRQECLPHPSVSNRKSQIANSTLHRFQPEGFIGLRLAVPVFERLTDDQIHLLEQESQAGERELARLIERLRARLGEEFIVQSERVESHLPENGYREIPDDQVTRRQGDKVTKALVTLSPCHLVCSFRPLHLLPMPVEIGVMVSPSHDRDGRPVSFTHEGRVHRVTHAVGPERIGGIWWTGHHRTRDYFDAADPTGRRFWLFRVVQTGKWYLHGAFE